MMRSLYGRINPIYALSKTVGSGDSTTSVIDMQGYTSLCLSFLAGVFALTSTNKVTLTILESDDNTTYGTVANTDTEGMETTSVFRAWDLSASDASTISNIHYRGAKRYVKAVLVEGGTVALPMSCVAICGDSHMNPSID